MTAAEKLEILKTLLGIVDPPAPEPELAKSAEEEETPQDHLLNTYLDLAKREIISWIYHLQAEVPPEVTDVPERFEVVQIMAVVAGYNLNGAENQTSHHENGINRSFRYADMVQYIRANVPANVGFGRS